MAEDMRGPMDEHGMGNMSKSSGCSSMAAMSMNMAFNSRNLGTALLFGSWLPETDFEFVMACLGIALTAAISVGMSNLKQRLEWWMTKCRWDVPAQNLARCLISFVVYTIQYAIMLLAMTFDIAIFFAVVGGLALGSLLFGHMGRGASWTSNLVYRMCHRRRAELGPEAIETELKSVADGSGSLEVAITIGDHECCHG